MSGNEGAAAYEGRKMFQSSVAKETDEVQAVRQLDTKNLDLKWFRPPAGDRAFIRIAKALQDQPTGMVVAVAEGKGKPADWFAVSCQQLRSLLTSAIAYNRSLDDTEIIELRTQVQRLTAVCRGLIGELRRVDGEDRPLSDELLRALGEDVPIHRVMQVSENWNIVKDTGEDIE